MLQLDRQRTLRRPCYHTYVLSVNLDTMSITNLVFLNVALENIHLIEPSPAPTLSSSTTTMGFALAASINGTGSSASVARRCRVGLKAGHRAKRLTEESSLGGNCPRPDAVSRREGLVLSLGPRSIGRDYSFSSWTSVSPFQKTRFAAVVYVAKEV